MTTDRHDDLLRQDWAAAWDTLPEAPALVQRPKTTQITLRLPANLLARIKRVARLRAVPYHVLARSWLVASLRDRVEPHAAAIDEVNGKQLNLKLEQEVLDQLKARASTLRRPYHRLAREWIEAAVGEEEVVLGLDSRPADSPAMKDLVVLLLHATDSRGQDAVRGITRLQKLLFVIEQSMGVDGGFYAYNYGPFDEGVNDAVDALQLAGFLRGTEASSAGPPTFEEMVASAAERSGPKEAAQIFGLNERGHEAAEQIRRSADAYEQLFLYISKLREVWDTSDLVERVYEAFPEYAQRSVIRDEIAERRAQRRRSGR